MKNTYRTNRKTNTNNAFISIITALIVVGILSFMFYGLRTGKFQGIQHVSNESSTDSQTVPSDNSYQPLPYTGNRQMVLNNLDNLGRATGAHIQLKDSDEPPSNSRKEKGTLQNCNPVGWQKGNQKIDGALLWDRGHLVGYQFSGIMCLNPQEDIKNFVPESHWFNAGAVQSFDGSNIDSMPYYENSLDKWLRNNPTYSLDYAVYPEYEGNDLVPHYIQLYYVGISPDGKRVNINLGGHEQELGNDISGVKLVNGAQPGVTIDYSTGRAHK
jgi:DNA-entry nuclease